MVVKYRFNKDDSICKIVKVQKVVKKINDEKNEVIVTYYDGFNDKYIYETSIELA